MNYFLTRPMRLMSAAFVFSMIAGFAIRADAAAPGALDPSFGLAGFVKTNILGNDRLNDIAVQDDGKIVAVGSSDVGDFTVVRYLVNGTRDTTFSGDGIVFIDLGATDIAKDVKIQKDGKIVVSGFLNGGSGSSGVVRLNSNGSLDTTFDTDGKLILANISSEGLEIQPDGKIVVAGTIAGDIGVIRLNSSGTFDTSFDVDGIVTTNVENGDTPSEVKLQADGKIVVAGNAGNSVTKSTVVRYNPNGSLDTTFSGDGIVLNDFGAGEPTRGLAIDSISGTITTIGDNFSPNTMLIVRYTSTGILDVSFSGDGILEIASPLLGGTEIVIQSDRKMVCSGHRGGSILDDVHLVRLNINGTIDTSFGNDGFVNLKDGGGSSERNLALVGDKLIIGNHANSFTDFGLERINLSATPTETGDFDGDGVTDSTVYRPGSGTWFTLRSLDNTFTIEQFGLSGDIPVDGDFDGDGRADLAIFRPSNGVWFFKRSSNGTTLGATFGQTGDKPVVGDYDKDGLSDIALWRPSNGNYFILRSSSNFSAFNAYPFGTNGDIPVQGGAQ